MRVGKTLDAETSGTNMADDDDFDFEAFYNKHPNEIKAIGGSLLAYFVVFEPLFQWMWDEGTRCGVWGDEFSCQGSAWLTLAYVSMASTVLAPGIWGGISMFAKNFTYVNDQQRGEVVWLATFGLPFAAIWATLWLYCFPHLWMLLPWGSWETNWWKIFPFIFGLIPMGGGPLFATIAGIGGKFKQFAEDEKRAHEFEEDFKTKLASSADETMKFEFSEEKILDSSGLPLTKENGEEAKVIQTEFTSILGDMKIHEKYKK